MSGRLGGAILQITEYFNKQKQFVQDAEGPITASNWFYVSSEIAGLQKENKQLRDKLQEIQIVLNR